MGKLKDIKKEIEATPIISSDIVNLLRLKRTTLAELADKLNLPEYMVKKKIAELKKDNYLISLEGGYYSLTEASRGQHVLNYKMWQGDKLKIGFVSDNHLGSKFAREDVLHMLYDLFEAEGIEMVIQAGNMVEGEAVFNRNELKVWGFDNQCKYAVENFPYRKGIKTYFITADDHEGWWAQKFGINFGDHIARMRADAGKNDFVHLGYLEADMELNGGKYENPMWLRVVHPGGGTPYAVSYPIQKLIESYQPGEKPQILFIGHYHKQLFMMIRGVYAVQPGATCDQGIFLRKNKIDVALGGAIVEITRNSDGIPSRVNCELISVFDKKFYKGKTKYWR